MSPSRVLVRCLFLLLCGLAAQAGLAARRGGAAAAELRFDGRQSPVSFPRPQEIDSTDIGDITVRFSRDAGAQDGAPILQIAGDTTTYIAVSYTDDNTALSFQPDDPDPNKGVTLGAGLKSRPDHVLRLTLGNGEWGVSIDGKAAGVLTAGDFATNRGEPLAIAVGGPGFVGKIDFTVTSVAGLPYASSGANRTIILRSVPSPGIYIQQDTGTMQPIPTRIGPNQDTSFHGVFDKNTYFGLTATPDGIAISVDWGGILEMVPDPANPDRYVPKNPAERWAGAVTFQAGSQPDQPASFTAVNSFARSNRPFLVNGVRYVNLPQRPTGEGEQAIGSVFSVNELPPNMNYSIQACYNVISMNVQNLAQTGCGNAFFALPPAKNGDYESAAPHIVPFGWRWYLNSYGSTTVFSTLATSSRDVASSWVGEQSSGFNILGITVSNNQKIESDMRTLAASEKMQAVQQSFQRLQSLVIDPNNIYLDPCFTRRVLRAAATLRAANLRIAPAKLTDAQLPVGPYYYEPGKQLQTCPEDIRVPLTVADFVKAYGTHYANAITYGGRSLRTSTFSRTEAQKMITEKVDLGRSIGLDFAQAAKLGGVDVKAGAEQSSSSSRQNSTTTLSSFEIESSKVECYGGSKCHDDGPDGLERNPAPVFLDLVRMDQLLAPPFFTDLAIIRDLRQAVASALDTTLAARPQSVAPIMRVIDAQLVSTACKDGWYVTDPTTGAVRRGYLWVDQLFCTFINSLSVSAYAVSGVDATRIGLQPLANTGATASVDSVKVSDLLRCASGTGPNCARPTYRIITLPAFDLAGNVKPYQSIGFRMFFTYVAPPPPLIRNCGTDCTQTLNRDLGLAFPESPIPACDTNSSAYRLGEIFTHACANAEKTTQFYTYPQVISTKFLGFPANAPVPASLSGPAMTYFPDSVISGLNAMSRAANSSSFQNNAIFKKYIAWFQHNLKSQGYAPLFTGSLTFKLTEENLFDQLGFAPPSAVAAQPANLSLALIEPNGTFPWLLTDPLNNSGMFRRCEAVFGKGNCVENVAIVYAKPASQRK